MVDNTLDTATNVVLARLGRLLARLADGPSEQDRAEGWNEEKTAFWIEILTETRGDLTKTESDRRAIWLAHGVARQLDFFGTPEGELAFELQTIATMIRDLDSSEATDGADRGA